MSSEALKVMRFALLLVVAALVLAGDEPFKSIAKDRYPEVMAAILERREAELRFLSVKANRRATLQEYGLAEDSLERSSRKWSEFSNRLQAEHNATGCELKLYAAPKGPDLVWSCRTK